MDPIVRASSRVFMLVLVPLISLSAQDSPNIPEMDTAGCASKHGVWSKSELQGIPGDGNRHNYSVSAPNGASAFLGGNIRGFRALLDAGFSFTCTINPAQPATVQNSEERRCTSPGNDMSVEKCTATSSSSGSLFICECGLGTEQEDRTGRVLERECWKITREGSRGGFALAFACSLATNVGC